MIINSITIENFLPFKDKTRLEFSTDPQKNVTLIRAENNIGKSSLLKAFIWCLYGEDKEDADQVLNDETEIDLKQGTTGNVKYVQVELDFSHQYHHYLLIRKWKYTYTGSSRLQIDKMRFLSLINENGVIQQIDETQADAILKQMLPQDLSEYFFFEEKKFANISQPRSIKTSVENFCGLTALNNALRHTNRAKQLMQDNMPSDNSSKLLKNIELEKNLRKEIDRYTAEINNYEEQEKYYQEEYEKWNNALIEKSSDIEIRNSYNRETNHLARLESEYESKKDRVVKQFNNNPIDYLLSSSEFQETKNLLKNANDEEKVETVQGITVTTINQIIKRGRCICGAEIREGTSGYDTLMKVKKVVPPHSVSDLVRVYESNLSNAKRNSAQYVDNIISARQDMKDDSNEIARVQDEIDGLKEKVSRTENTDDIQSKINDAKEKMYRFRRQKEDAIRNLSSKEAIYQHTQKQIEILQKKSEKGKLYIKRTKFIDEVIKSLEDEIETKQKDLLEKMNESVGSYFKKIYHGTRSLKIDNEYNIQVSNDYRGKELSSRLSSGTNDVKNFAFVFGLEDLAKGIINGDDARKEAYPLILDGPFSHVDSLHISNICEILPNISSQIILAVSNKDWELSKKYLQDYLGREYVMKKVSEEHTKIEEVQNV